MTRRAYIPEENLPGVTTVVTDKSRDGLPNDISREPETNLPPGSATPNAPRKEDTADGNGRVLASPSYNTPGTDEPGPLEHPRTVGLPGDQEGSPTKYDYGMPTRRTMTAYEPRMPWKRQRKQRVWDRLKSKREYRQNKSQIKHRTNLWYKRVRKNQQFKTRREKRRENPQKYERRRQGDEMIVEAYAPTPLSTRKRRQHGPAKMRSHRNYVHNRAKARRRQHIWYQRNKNKPAFKRRQKMRRLNPNRFHLRPGAYVPGHDIGFVFGPDMLVGQVDSVSADAVVFSVLGGDPTRPYDLSPAAFLHAVVFDSPESMAAMFEVLDDEVGAEAYDDLTQDDLSDIAALYGVAIPEVFLTDPAAISSMARSIVEEAMDGWDDPSPLAQRVADLYLVGLGEMVLYDQGRPDASHDQAVVVKRDLQEHEPTPGGYEKPEESGVSAPGSSGKVVPDSMKTAATIADIERHVAADVAKRARSVKVRLSRADQKNGIWTFRAAGSEGRDYTVRVKAEARGNTKDVSKLQVKLSCDCDFFRFQGPEHWARANDYLYGKPRGTAAAPVEKDAAGKHWACKHALAALALARQYRVAGDGAWWPAGADVVPAFERGPSAARVADRYGGT
jgi:hypothetical protein